MTAPAVLHGLLRAEHPESRQQAWDAFLAEHSRLLLYVARSYGGGYDAAMDRYAHLLDQLSRDDFRRLRAFAEDGRSSFTSWLVVVAQRICLDQHRQRYGRSRAPAGPGEPPAADRTRDEERAGRRRLVDLVAEAVDPDVLPGASVTPDRLIERDEISGELEAALAALAPREQALLRLRFDDDVPMPEIARLMGFPTRFHAYRCLKNALAELRATLARRGVSDAEL